MKSLFLSDIGKVRKVNEDSVGLYQNQKQITLGLVADGIGGNRGGDVASAMIVQHLGYLFEESAFETVVQAYEWLQKQVQVENDLLIQKGKQYPDLEGMGSTLVLILIDSVDCIIANIGDSRGYRLRKNELQQISRDHSLVNELIKQGAITKEEAANHPQKNVIVKTLGINHDAQMDHYALKVEPDDLFLLCTDGLSKLVTEAKIKAILTASGSLEEKCQQLITQARVNGGDDNITALLIAADESGEQQCE